MEESLQRLKIVFQHLKDCNLKLLPSKCSFLWRSVKSLGHIVTHEGLASDLMKAESITNVRVGLNGGWWCNPFSGKNNVLIVNCYILSTLYWVLLNDCKLAKMNLSKGCRKKAWTCLKTHPWWLDRWMSSGIWELKCDAGEASFTCPPWLLKTVYTVCWGFSKWHWASALPNSGWSCCHKANSFCF